MIDWSGLWDALGNAGWAFLLPLYVVAIAVIAVRYGRQIRMQRLSFHARLQSVAWETWRSVRRGVVIGVLFSAAMLFVGTALDLYAALCLWALALVGMLLRFRFLSSVYAIGIVGLVQGAVMFVPDWREAMQSIPFVGSLLAVHVPSLLLLAALFLAVEALLVRRDSVHGATPLYVQGKRGKMIGAFQLLRYYPVPLLLPVPAATGASGIDFTWTTWFAIEASGGWTWLFIPLVFGYGERTTALLPSAKAHKRSRYLLYSAAFLLGFAFLGGWFAPLVIVAALLALVLPEAVHFAGAQDERKGTPYFVPDPSGLKLLGAVPGSPAAELGIAPGETLVRVNGHRVTNTVKLHAALQENPAFCKLEVVDTDGESRYLQRAIFAGDPHLLGLLPVPQGDEERGAEMSEKTALQGWIAPAERPGRGDDEAMSQVAAAVESDETPTDPR